MKSELPFTPGVELGEAGIGFAIGDRVLGCGAAVLAGSPLVASQLRACAFGGLLDIEAHKRQVLLDTLDSWFRNNHSASDVGAELHCHRNTVMHRLSRVEALSGRWLADSRDELVLRLALLTG